MEVRDGFIVGILGARLFHLLEYPRDFLAHPAEMLLSRSGFTIFGGLIVGILAGAKYARRKRAPLAPLLDAVAPALMLSYGIGRIGCQISGDGDWGITVSGAPPAWLVSSSTSAPAVRLAVPEKVEVIA